MFQHGWQATRFVPGRPPLCQRLRPGGAYKVRLVLSIGAATAFIAAAIWLLPPTGTLAVGGINILPWILPSVMIFAVAEGILLRLRPWGYDWKAWFASSSDAMIRQVVNLVPLSLVGPAFACVWQHRLFTVPFGAPWNFALLLVGQEFCRYWLHWASHHVRWFWAIRLADCHPARLMPSPVAVPPEATVVFGPRAGPTFPARLTRACQTAHLSRAEPP